MNTDIESMLHVSEEEFDLVKLHTPIVETENSTEVPKMAPATNDSTPLTNDDKFIVFDTCFIELWNCIETETRPTQNCISAAAYLTSFFGRPKTDAPVIVPKSEKHRYAAKRIATGISDWDKEDLTRCCLAEVHKFGEANYVRHTFAVSRQQTQDLALIYTLTIVAPRTIIQFEGDKPNALGGVQFTWASGIDSKTIDALKNGAFNKNGHVYEKEFQQIRNEMSMSMWSAKEISVSFLNVDIPDDGTIDAFMRGIVNPPADTEEKESK